MIRQSQPCSPEEKSLPGREENLCEGLEVETSFVCSGIQNNVYVESKLRSTWLEGGGLEQRETKWGERKKQGFADHLRSLDVIVAKPLVVCKPRRMEMAPTTRGHSGQK